MKLEYPFSIPFYDRSSDPTEDTPDVEPEINLLSGGTRNNAIQVRLHILDGTGAHNDEEVKYMIDDDEALDDQISTYVT